MASERRIQISELRDAMLQSINVADFYSQYLSSDCKRLFQDKASSGWSNRVLCPIPAHNDKTTPNLFINLKTGAFKCHACNAGGSFIDFYMHMHSMDVYDKKSIWKAVQEVAQYANFDLEAYRKSGGDAILAAKHSNKNSTGKKPEENWEPKENKANEYDRQNDPVHNDIVDRYKSKLEPEHILYLNQVRGLTRKTIEKWNIGFNPDARVKATTGEYHEGRFALPVQNILGQFRNIRMYSPKAPAEQKMINLVIDKGTQTERRFGAPTRLYGLHLIYNNPIIENIVICEGEWDCLLLNQMFEEFGYNSWAAVTGTAGANKFMREWIAFMFDKNVYWCLDCDEPGKLATNNHIVSHFVRPMEKGKFKSVRSVLLPLPGTKDSKDLGDYLLRSGFTVHDFVKLCTDTPEMMVAGVDSDEASTDSIKVESFIEAIKNREYIDKRITVPLTVVGCSDRIYHAIRSYKVTKCDLLAEGECCMGEDLASCQEQVIPYGHPLFIESCMERQGNILHSIGKMVCERARNVPGITPLKKVVMEKYMAHQVITRWRAEENPVTKRLENTQELTQAPIYVLQPPERVNIEPQSYMATGWIRTDPKTCAVTFFVEQMVPMEKNWKKFDMRIRENFDLIKQIKENFKTNELKNQIVNGVTKIYNADEILYGVLLTYLSPIQFAFNGTLLRGWINAAIIGDSGTGKSQTYMRFSDWIETGDLFSALTGSRTGLLYSIKSKGGEWFVSIGRYVQASDTIIAIDESQEILKEEIKQMAHAMDLGYLKVERVASGGYHTRTRSLFLLNPKDRFGNAATVSDFADGCEALMQCFDPMFIRRLDFAIFVTGGQDYGVYNKKVISGGNAPMTLTAKMMRSLVYWAWTRAASQVLWSDEATDKCLQSATELSQIYGDADKIPLVNPQDFRENLARLSVAFAILDRSFTDDLESVVILPKHVEFIVRYLNMIYSAPACNLRQFSKRQKSKSSIEDYLLIKETIEKVLEQEKTSSVTYVRECLPFIQMLSVIQQLNGIQGQQLCDQINMPKVWVNRRISTLQSLNMLEVTRNGYKGTRRFNLFMRKWQSEEGIEKMFDEARKSIGRFQSGEADVLPEYTNEYKKQAPTGDPFK